MIYTNMATKACKITLAWLETTTAITCSRSGFVVFFFQPLVILLPQSDLRQYQGCFHKCRDCGNPSLTSVSLKCSSYFIHDAKTQNASGTAHLDLSQAGL